MENSRKLDQNNRKYEQNEEEKPRSLLTRSLITGFIGGIIWGTAGVILYYFSFSEVAPKNYLIRSWATGDWTDGWLGTILSILFIGVISLLTALIYYGLFKKVNTMWMGAGYGVIMWVIVFYIIQPIFPNIPELHEFSRYTIVTTLCLYILYGTFIGYSISYDYQDNIRMTAEKEGKKSESED